MTDVMVLSVTLAVAMIGAIKMLSSSLYMLASLEDSVSNLAFKSFLTITLPTSG